MNQELLDRILPSPRLPSLPTIALDVIDLVSKKNVDIKQIAQTISHDPALSGKILKTVNSSFYGQKQNISTISHALVVLGLNSVKTLALGFSLVPRLREAGVDGFDHLVFWKRSIYAAVAARRVARQINIVQQEEAFLGGLLQDLGVLAFAQVLGEPYCQIVAQVGGSHRRLIELERKNLKMDHAELGGALTEHWKFPPVLVTPVRYHEQPENAPADLAPLTYCVALSGRVAEVFTTTEPTGALNTYIELAEKWIGLKRDVTEPLINKIHQATVEMSRLFELPTGPLESPGAILSRANEALLQISLQQQQHTDELEKQNTALTAEATTDPLTGAANRRKFNEFITDQFELAKSGAGPLSILFLDGDKFKTFNDTYGHATGDRVLAIISKTLRDVMPNPSLVARYGGEEFAVVLPQTDRITAARIAEQARVAISKAPITGDKGEELHITASIGVATFDPAVPGFEKAEQIVKAADQGVYAAKKAGRNCVRVFTPRKPATQQAA